MSNNNTLCYLINSHNNEYTVEPETTYSLHINSMSMIIITVYMLWQIQNTLCCICMS